MNYKLNAVFLSSSTGCLNGQQRKRTATREKEKRATKLLFALCNTMEMRRKHLVKIHCVSWKATDP